MDSVFHSLKRRPGRNLLRLGLGLTFTLIGGFAAAQGNAPDLDALTKAARAEGELTYYTSNAENVGRRIGSAFTAKYGIKTQFVRLNSVPLQQRYSTEAETGNFAADAIFIAGNATAYAAEGIKKGWIESISEAGLPVIRSGEFPRAFNRGPTAIVQVSPWLIFFNTDKVKGADVPKDWPDLLDPKWKGQVLLADPRASDAHIPLWSIILDKYGEEFFHKLRAQGLRVFSGGPPTIQSLAAGEGSVAVPTIESSVQEIKSKGGPLNTVTPDLTTGVEMHIVLTARTKAKHPNAARLFANYVMSPEGNKVFNDDPGGLTIYDTKNLPKDYRAPDQGALARKERIFKLLGF